MMKFNKYLVVVLAILMVVAGLCSGISAYSDEGSGSISGVGGGDNYTSDSDLDEEVTYPSESADDSSSSNQTSDSGSDEEDTSSGSSDVSSSSHTSDGVVAYLEDYETANPVMLLMGVLTLAGCCSTRYF